MLFSATNTKIGCFTPPHSISCSTFWRILYFADALSCNLHKLLRTSPSSHPFTPSSTHLRTKKRLPTMQGFNMGRYRPPSADPRREPFNATHPLGKRARRLASHGVLVVRFELPFHVFCLSCNAHIAQGRRFNAEKAHVGDYLSTKIWAFTCKCTCGERFEIRTDPQNAQYTVHSGARRQMQEWDPAEHGGHPIYDTEAGAKAPGTEAPQPAQDAFAQLEQRENDKSKAKQREARILQLQQHADSTWSDPYTLNANLRRSFRREKSNRTQQLEKDLQLKDRIGWHQDHALVPDASPSTAKRESAAWKAQRSKLTTKHHASRDRGEGASSAAQRLQARLVANSRKKTDPFLQQVNSIGSSKITSRNTLVRAKPADTASKET